ncbi:hypothetical protein [Actinomadura rupiterrae]|uniref:hypothetical protein n=1 Tax=Actinomadura rupiterrae TaxID=559627 RepID=UPI0020A3C009|nr:hypothetical protein [Actinomadura rupiterrae]MCP2342300.1 hypothetical protein [Actinomadura rupiterrae]
MEPHLLATASHVGAGLGVWLGPVVGAAAVATMLFLVGRGLLGTINAGRHRTVHREDDSHLDSLEHGGFYRYEPGMYSHSDVEPEPAHAPSKTQP